MTSTRGDFISVRGVEFVFFCEAPSSIVRGEVATRNTKV